MRWKSVLVGAGLLVALGVPASAQARAWRVVASPNPQGDEALFAVARVPGTAHFWAVGSWQNNVTPGDAPLIVHTTGAGWSMVSAPAPSVGGVLNDVAARGPRNAWAVGNSGAEPLVERWNGNRWQIVAVPSGAALNGVKVFTASDVLAVGYSGDLWWTSQAVVYHWNGSAWNVTTLPTPGVCDRGATAQAVAAVPGTAKRFAVGWCVSSSTGTGEVSVVWKLAAGAWRVAWTQANAGEFNDITPVGPTSIWAVGGTDDNRPLIAHWNGTRWSNVAVPASLSNDFFRGVIRVPGTQTVWAVGGSNTDPTAPIAARHTGAGWKRIAVPHLGELWSVAASSSANVYGVGIHWNSVGVPDCGGPDECQATTLIDRYH